MHWEHTPGRAYLVRGGVVIAAVIHQEGTKDYWPKYYGKLPTAVAAPHVDAWPTVTELVQQNWNHSEYGDYMDAVKDRLVTMVLDDKRQLLSREEAEMDAAMEATNATG